VKMHALQCSTGVCCINNCVKSLSACNATTLKIRRERCCINDHASGVVLQHGITFVRKVLQYKNTGSLLNMEPDSSSLDCDNVFLHSSASCETLVDPTDLFCSNCRVPEVDQGRLQTILLTTQPGSLFFVLSTCYLLCQQCTCFIHLHCYLNSEEITIDNLILLIESLPFTCQECKNGQPQ